MHKYLALYIGLLLICFGQLSAQDDSTYFKEIEPTFDDLDQEPQVEISSGLFSRNPQKLVDIAATVYVVDQKEIVEQGYLTLVDVLENVPGIMTSQPGNAINGELFMIRGMLGNYYCKILINGVPIQPSAVGGMPIGGQLPIRQADHIEILFGPAAANYGGDAMAGVVNIITKKTRKSSVIQADLTVGNNKYNRLNVFYGGKLGRVKKNIQYTLFANYFQQGNVYLDGYNDSIYNPESYTPIKNTPFDYKSFNNYEAKDSLSNPTRRNLALESYLIGGTIDVDRFHFGYFSMNRKAHSALGLNPGAVSYADPSTFYGEKINRFTAAYEIKNDNIRSISRFSYLRYRVNSESSQRKLVTTDDMLLYESAKLFDDATQNGGVFQKAAEDELRQREKSYIYGGSDDLFLEQIVDFDFDLNKNDRILSKLEFTMGANFQYSGNLPMLDNSPAPFDNPYYIFSEETYYSNDSTISAKPFNYLNAGAFGQVFWTYQKLNILTGLRYDYHSIYKGFLNPRVAVNYKINNDVVIRASYNTAHRTPSSFYSGYSYVLGLNQDGFVDGDFNSSLRAEKLQSLETGIKFNLSENTQFDFVLFYNEVKDKIQKEIVRELDTTNNGQDFELYVRNGFTNVNKTQIGGVKISVFNKKFLLQSLSSRLSASYNYSKVNYSHDVIGGLTDDLYNVPAFFADWHLSYLFPFQEIKMKLEINQVFSSNYYQGQITRSVFGDNVELFEQEYTVPYYYKIDLGLRYITSSVRLEVFAYLKNVFDKKYGGISATGSPDDIYINPQQGRRFQVGVRYRFGLDE